MNTSTKSPQVFILDHLQQALSYLESILTRKGGGLSTRCHAIPPRVGTLSAGLPSAVCWSGCGAERAMTQARIVDRSRTQDVTLHRHAADPLHRATVVHANARERAAAARDAHATVFRCALPTAVGLSPRLERLPAHSTPRLIRLRTRHRQLRIVALQLFAPLTRIATEVHAQLFVQTRKIPQPKNLGIVAPAPGENSAFLGLLDYTGM